MFGTTSEELPLRFATSIDNYMRFRGRGFTNSGTSSGAMSVPYCTSEEWGVYEKYVQLR